MSKINEAIYEIRQMDQLAARDQWMNTLHPLVKLCLTVMYIFIVVNCNNKLNFFAPTIHVVGRAAKAALG